MAAITGAGEFSFHRTAGHVEDTGCKNVIMDDAVIPERAGVIIAKESL